MLGKKVTVSLNWCLSSQKRNGGPLITSARGKLVPIAYSVID